MKLETVPARAGALWVRQGFAVFFKRPMGFAGLFAAFLFAAFLVTLVPWLGPLLLTASLPLVSLGFMVATRIAQGGGNPMPTAFTDPLRSNATKRIAYLQLGLVNAVATAAILWLGDMVDGGALDALMDGLPAGQMTPEQLTERLVDPRFELGLLVRFGLEGLLAIPLWHAPALVHWDGQSCAKSMFSSTVACWRNKGAFTVYSLTWAGVILAFALVANLVFALLGHAELIAAAAMPATLLFWSVFYASLYFTYAACFVDDAAAPTPDPLLKGTPP